MDYALIVNNQQPVELGDPKQANAFIDSIRPFIPLGLQLIASDRRWTIVRFLDRQSNAPSHCQQASVTAPFNSPTMRYLAGGVWDSSKERNFFKWPFWNPGNDPIDLPEDDPEIFENYLRYVYSTSIGQVPNGDVHFNMIRTHILADKHGDLEAANSIID